MLPESSITKMMSAFPLAVATATALQVPPLLPDVPLVPLVPPLVPLVPPLAPLVPPPLVPLEPLAPLVPLEPLGLAKMSVPLLPEQATTRHTREETTTREEVRRRLI